MDRPYSVFKRVPFTNYWLLLEQKPTRHVLFPGTNISLADLPAQLEWWISLGGLFIAALMMIHNQRTYICKNEYPL
jgi:hypothetical protein